MASYLKGYKPGKARGVPAPYLQSASDHQKATYLRHIKEGDHAGEARRAANLSRDEFQKAFDEDPDFRKAVADLDAYYIDKIEEAAVRAALRGDTAMMRFFLENARPEKYGKKSQVKVTHSIQSAEDVRNMSDEDLQATFELMGLEASS